MIRNSLMSTVINVQGNMKENNETKIKKKNQIN
eukprot:UN3188